jgi:hypothetical protein
MDDGTPGWNQISDPFAHKASSDNALPKKRPRGKDSFPIRREQGENTLAVRTSKIMVDWQWSPNEGDCE